ncbi:MAG TPA: lytic transglycosylase domain-containing protein, partial [Candidatus Edwardsbacteria bacterium]|nr:lytic transglycosylase domain-containing protein [Candidatus Edwardsbacteria bacterium]
VIHKESKFDERCRSWAGARGLMQVMPKTGRLLAGNRKFPKDRLYDPLLSIAFGTKFLGAMLREFNGSWMQALAAYNAGPARVHAWLQDRNSRRDEDYFLEQIFVPETKRYVQVVMENYYMYRLLLHEEAGS